MLRSAASGRSSSGRHPRSSSGKNNESRLKSETNDVNVSFPFRFLTVMMKHGYIGEFEIVDDHRGGKIVVNLTGRLNKCGVISPRFDVGIRDVEKWTNNLLPSRQFG